MYIYIYQGLTVTEWLQNLSMVLERSIPLPVERIIFIR